MSFSSINVPRDRRAPMATLKGSPAAEAVDDAAGDKPESSSANQAYRPGLMRLIGGLGTFAVVAGAIVWPGPGVATAFAADGADSRTHVLAAPSPAKPGVSAAPAIAPQDSDKLNALSATGLIAEAARPKKKALAHLADFDSYKGGDKDGYLIVTTNDLTHRLKQLEPFIEHKAKARGFRMFVATEDEFGGGIGQDKALQIRDWMRDHHEKLGLKYVLFIGVGHPSEGDIPMVMANGRHPTDYFYTDLTGDWDLNGNGEIADAEDYGPGGIDAQPEVFVGRIPYYGEDSDYGKAVDTDIILARSIRYENEKDISWRYNFTQLRQWDMVPYEVFFERDVLEPAGINYVRDKDYQDTIGFPHYDLHAEGTGMSYNVAKLRLLDMGYTRLGGHGNPTSMHGINSGGVRKYLNDERPTVVNMGACLVGMIENQHNLAYTLLRYHAIVTHGGTRSVSGFGGKPSREYNERLLLDKKSTGEAWWNQFADRFVDGRISGTAFLINLYGDPSITPFPTGLDLPYPFTAKPVKPYHQVAASPRRAGSLPAHTLTLHNHKEKPTRVSVTTSEPWLLADRKSIDLLPDQTKELRFRINAGQASKLAPGMHQAEMLLDDGKGYVCKRLFYLEIADSKMTNLFTFEGAGRRFTDQLGSNRAIWIDSRDKEVDSISVEGVVGKAVRTDQYHLRGDFKSPNQGSFTYAFWIKRDDLNQRAHLLGFDQFMDLRAEGQDKLRLSLREFDVWGKDRETAFRAEQEMPFRWKAGEWTHVIVSFDRSKGAVVVYQDGKAVGTVKTPTELTFAPKGYRIGRFAGAIDEFMVYNKPLSPSDVKQAYASSFVASPKPSHLTEGVIAGDVELKFAAGENVEVSRLVLTAKGGASRGRISVRPDENGRWIAKGLQANTLYQWRVEGKHNGRPIKTPIWSFKTSQNLVANGDFEGEKNAWRGGTIRRNVRQALAGEASLVIPHQGSAVVRAEGAIRADMGYSVQCRVRTAWRKLVHYELYTVIAGKEVSLKKYSEHMYQNREGNTVSFDFFAYRGQPYIGKPLYLRISNDPNEGSEAFVDNVVLTPYAHKSTNEGPRLIADLDAYKPAWPVYDNNIAIRLNDFVTDPEGQPLTFLKIDGPDWLRVRGGEIMSNFGPSEDDLGENTITVHAVDSQNVKLEMVFTIDVTDAAPETLQSDRALLARDATLLKGNGSKMNHKGDRVVGWHSTADRIEFGSPNMPAGEYDIIVHYLCDTAQAGSKMMLDLAGEPIAFTTRGSSDRALGQHLVGRVKYTEAMRGKPVVLRCLKLANDWAMDPQRIMFRKVVPGQASLEISDSDSPTTKELYTKLHNRASTVTWSFTPTETRGYRLSLHARAAAAGQAKLTVGDQVLTFPIHATGDKNSMGEHVAGVVNLRAGQPVRLTVGVVEYDAEHGLGDISHLSIIPHEDQAPRFTQRPVNLTSSGVDGIDLRGMVSDESPDALRFYLMEGPSWVTISEAGAIETKRTAPAGRHLVKVLVVDENGKHDWLRSKIVIDG